MGKPCCRKGDKCTGHPCVEPCPAPAGGAGAATPPGPPKMCPTFCPPRPCTQGRPDTFVNGRPAHRQGDKWGPHKHGSTLCDGSPKVFTNGKKQGRLRDPVCCGSKVAEGSPDTIIGP